MKLKIISGPSGSGKSRYIYEKIIRESIKEPDRTFIFVVPEQTSMQVQKELVRMHPAHSIVNIDVLSFNRLAYRVFSETGRGNLPVIEDLGKTLIIQKVMRDTLKDLGPYKRAFERPGAAEKMKSLISEFMQYRVLPEDLKEIESEKGIPALLKLKLGDVSRIYEKYRQYLSDRYLSAEEVPEMLAEAIPSSKLLKDATVVFDGFTGFVPTQLPVAEQLLSHVREVIAVITAGCETDLTGPEKEGELFALSKQMAGGLIKAAKNAGAEIEEPLFMAPGNGRFRNNQDLEFLSENIFRYNSRVSDSYEGRISVFTADNIRQEARFIASVIKRKVRKEGFSYGDFAIVTGDIELYGDVLENMLEGEEIPCFLDKKQSVLHDPLVEFVRGAAQMCAENFSYDGVMRFLKCGLFDFTEEETDLLENYVLAAGIRGRKQWFSEWTRVTRYFKEEDLTVLNDLRERFVSGIAGFSDMYRKRGSTAGEKTRALYSLIEQCAVQQKLKVLEDACEAAGNTAAAREYARIYKAVMDLFDRLCEVMDDEVCGMEAFADILDAGFSEMRVGYIPIGQDRVIIGDIKRSRVKNRKVFFFAGINDGIIPADTDKSGILTEGDRETMEKFGMMLSPDARKDMYDQRLYLYLNLTAPSDELYLSYAAVGTDGSKKQPSYLIGMIKELFPDIKVLSAACPEIRELFLETRSGREEVLFDGLKGSIREDEKGRFIALVRHLSDTPAGRHLAEKLNAAVNYANSSDNISPETAEKIYGDDPKFSVSGLQQYASCAFAHFCQRALALKDRETYEFEARDRGDLLHRTLEEYIRSVSAKGISWDSINDEQRDAIVGQIFDHLALTYNNSILSESGSNKAQAENLKRLAKSAAWALTEQIKKGSFVPYGTEISYRTGHLRGTIDRMDICGKDGKKYIRVIDYKTGSEKLDFYKMYEGLQLQLPVYMMAALEMVDASEPAGLYYYNVKEKILEVESMDTELEEDALKKSMRLNGLSRSEPEVIGLSDPELSDPDLIGKKSVYSTAIYADRTKSGKYSRYTSVASGADFRLINEYVRKKTEDMREEILSGAAKTTPYSGSTYSPKGSCGYCAFRDVCGFDERIPGFKKKQSGKSLSLEDALVKMRSYLDKH